MKVGKPKMIREDGVMHIAFPVAEYLPARQMVVKLGNKKSDVFELTVASAKKKRSVDQNELMWKLCQLIAEAIGATKNDVYREHIRDYGDWINTLVRKEDSSEIMRQWESNGVGWIAEEFGESNGLVKVRLYAGSSTYSTIQMKRLIDSLMDECKNLGIEADERLASLYASI